MSLRPPTATFALDEPLPLLLLLELDDGEGLEGGEGDEGDEDDEDEPGEVPDDEDEVALPARRRKSLLCIILRCSRSHLQVTLAMKMDMLGRKHCWVYL